MSKTNTVAVPSILRTLPPETLTAKMLDEGLLCFLGGLSLCSPKGCALEGRRGDVETGIWWSCCGELNLLVLFCMDLGVADAFQKQHLRHFEREDGKKGKWGLWLEESTFWCWVLMG